MPAAQIKRFKAWSNERRMRLLKVITLSLLCVIVLGTVLPLIRTDEWWIRVLDFTHLQVTALGLLTIPALLFLRRRMAPRLFLALLAVLIVAVMANVWWLYPYTRLARIQVLPAVEHGAELRILAANVLQKNQKSDLLLKQIEENRPDLILITEADERWTRELNPLTLRYPHTVLHPLTNTYGINLYSRFPLIDPQVRFLTDRGVPSICTGIRVGGRIVRFYGVHPRPPGRPAEGDLEPLDSTQRDAELVLVAREIKELGDPVVVAGDFNDVAWSHTSRKFRRISRLLDPRVGRGFYNTYHAKTPLLRFPLDHLFHSDDFTFVEMRRLDAMGSDHFPIFAAIRLQPSAAPLQEAPPEKDLDQTEAVETIQKHAAEDSDRKTAQR